MKKDVINDISAINDESGREHKCRIVVDLKRDADPNVIINQLYQYTPCQITVSMINIALVNRQPRTMGLKELIQHFIEHRKEVITRRTRFLLRKAQQREHILEGLIFAVCDIDEVVQLIRSSKTREEAIDKLRERAFRIAPQTIRSRLADSRSCADRSRAGAERPAFRLTQAQAEAIGRLQLIQLVGLEMEKLVEEYRKVVEEIEGYEAILRDEALVLDIIREDIFEMKEKYGDERRTENHGRRQRIQHGGADRPGRRGRHRLPRGIRQAASRRHLPQPGPRRTRDSRVPKPRRAISSSISSSPTRTITCSSSPIRGVSISGGCMTCRK